MNQQQVTGIIIVVALVAGGLGYAIGSGSVTGTMKATSTGAVLPSELMPDTNFLFGEIKAIDGNVITFSTPYDNPDDEAPETRKVTVTSATKITRFENKPAETIKKEQEEYAKKYASIGPDSALSPPPPPSLFIEKEISLSDIKPGEGASIEAGTPIRLKENFEAVRITLQPNTPPVTTAPPISDNREE